MGRMVLSSIMKIRKVFGRRFVGCSTIPKRPAVWANAPAPAPPGSRRNGACAPSTTSSWTRRTAVHGGPESIARTLTRSLCTMAVRPATFADSLPVTATEAMTRWHADGGVRPRVLIVARWPVGGIRTHLLANYTALREAGFRFTFVGPADESLDSLRAGFGNIEEAGFVGAPVENRRCRLWPVVRGLLREGRFGLLHSHGVTAAVHAALANLGLGVPHVATLHEPLR